MSGPFLELEETIEHGETQVRVAIWSDGSYVVDGLDVSIIVNFRKGGLQIDVDNRPGHGGKGDPINILTLNGKHIINKFVEEKERVDKGPAIS